MISVINKVVDVIVAIFKALLAVFIMVFMQLVVAFGMAAFNLDYKQYEGLYCFLYSVSAIAVMLLVLYPKFRYSYNQPVRKQKMTGLSPFWIFVIAMAMLGVTSLFLAFVHQLSESNEAVNTAVEEYSESMDRFSEVEEDMVPMWDHWLYFFSTFMLIPMVEELVFRGGVLESFARKFKAPVAVILSAVVFGLVHGISIQIIYALICGIVIGAVYCICDSIWASYMVHAVFNFFGSSLMTLLQCSAFGISESILDRIFSGIFLAELASIIPSILAFHFLIQECKKYKIGKNISLEVESANE